MASPMNSGRQTGARPGSSHVRLRIAGVAFLGIMLLLCFAIFRKQNLPALEVPSSNLVLLDGRLYRKSETNVPFTGLMVEKYSPQSLKSRSMISNGVLQGLSEGWHTNGQLQVRESFQKGVSHGLRTKWHENGAKLSEGMVVEGKLQGPFRRWHENGQLAEEMNLKEGAPDGLTRSYYPSGFVKAQARLKGGEVSEQKFWKDGELNEAPVLGAKN
jgi:antitoxin component YwqK of YwqJK toxin-antitoxin module